MYLQRCNGHYWFRKATPLDRLRVVGQAEIRCSLRTTRHDVAKRRAGQLLVALDNVYAALRSEHPIEPMRALVANLARDALEKAAGVFPEMDHAARRLQQAVDALGAPTLLPSTESPDTLVAIKDIDVLIQRERPQTEANQIAAELLTLAMRIRREKSWARSERAKVLVFLCQRLIAVSERDVPRWIEAVRSIIRKELSSLSSAAAAIGTHHKSMPTPSERS